MPDLAESSDARLLDLLRQTESMNVAQLAGAMGVTATAVRQRLTRVMKHGLVARHAASQGRGRPSHRYELTEKGRRQAGANFDDLALALWSEVRAIEDPDVRRGLLQRIAKKMAAMYGERVQGTTTAERMQEVSRVFADREVPLEVEHTDTDSLPVLKVVACPYPRLAEQDRGICALERMMFSELIGSRLRLSECRLDGDACCRFESNEVAVAATN